MNTLITISLAVLIYLMFYVTDIEGWFSAITGAAKGAMLLAEILQKRKAEQQRKKLEKQRKKLEEEKTAREAAKEGGGEDEEEEKEKEKEKETTDKTINSSSSSKEKEKNIIPPCPSSTNTCLNVDKTSLVTGNRDSGNTANYSTGNTSKKTKSKGDDGKCSGKNAGFYYYQYPHYYYYGDPECLYKRQSQSGYPVQNSYQPSYYNEKNAANLPSQISSDLRLKCELVPE